MSGRKGGKTAEEVPGLDDTLLSLSEATHPMMEVFDTDDNAIFTLGAHFIEGETEEESGVQTFIAVAGNQAVLAEGLFVELMDMIENGDPSIFVVLRDVVRSIEQELDIEPDEDLEDDEPPTHLY